MLRAKLADALLAVKILAPDFTKRTYYALCKILRAAVERDQDLGRTCLGSSEGNCLLSIE